MEGALLGDGYLQKRRPESPGCNATFSYTTASKQHADFVLDIFRNLCTKNFQKVNERRRFDKRTGKTYIAYTFNTRSLPCLTELYDKWYPGNKKVVPEDIKLTKEALLLWYIGDGQLNSLGYHIYLHTECFKKEEVERLSNKIGLDSYPYEKNKEKGQYVIRVPKSGVVKFLDIIGPCPFSDYSHKWDRSLLL